MQVPSVLLLDKAGQPIEWAHWQTAVSLYARDSVVWTHGDVIWTARGGTNRESGVQSTIDLHSMVAVNALAHKKVRNTPPLTNRALFRRDENLCLYCGKEYSDRLLTRDHVIPISRGGKDVWSNVVSACRACNHKKGSRLPEECGMPLMALPYVPNHAEYLALLNSGRILADQMEFLKPFMPCRDRY